MSAGALGIFEKIQQYNKSNNITNYHPLIKIFWSDFLGNWKYSVIVSPISLKYDKVESYIIFLGPGDAKVISIFHTKLL